MNDKTSNPNENSKPRRETIELKLGDYNRLRVKEEARREGYGEVFGLYLDGGREGEILMPQRYVPERTQERATTLTASSISTKTSDPLPPLSDPL